MRNFTFYNPVCVHFGKGQISALAKEIPAPFKVLMTYGGGSIKKNGVYDQVLKALKDHTIVEFPGIEPNPTYETCMKAVEVVRKEDVDFILSVGGGSVLDGSKFIAAAARHQGKDPWDIVLGKESVQDAVPLGCV
ncbi:MAG: iron-containing alcohol dehydrogenase, partial [Candidatus Hinthialibacter sp.]